MELKKKYFVVLGLVVVVILGIVFFRSVFVGHAILKLDGDYVEGQPFDGILRLSLGEGEFVPASSVVVFENNGQRREVVLSDVVLEAPVEGVYYVEGKNISGEGLGYGLIGDSSVYPEVSFRLAVSGGADEGSDSGASGGTVKEEVVGNEINESEEVIVGNESNESEDVANETSDEAVNETSDEAVADEAANETSDEVGDEGSIITGNVVLDYVDYVSGEVSADSPFSYELSEGQSVELVSGSVRVGSEVLDDDVLNIDISDGVVSVSTNYSMEANGGVLEIGLSDIGLNLSEGDLDISLVYGENEIASLSSRLKSEVAVDNKSVLVGVVDNLSEEERGIFVEEFGNVSVESSRSELVGGRLIRNYKVGDYELVASYDYSLDREILEGQMEKDKVNFIRDLVRMVSRERVSPEGVDEFLGSSDF